MRFGRTSAVLALALALGSSSPSWAQSQNGGAWFAAPPSPPRNALYYHHYHQHCSLDQREYAYINECGEWIPGMWDWVVGSG